MVGSESNNEELRNIEELLFKKVFSKISMRRKQV